MAYKIFHPKQAILHSRRYLNNNYSTLLKVKYYDQQKNCMGQKSTNLRINRSKHQNASASSSRRIIMGEQRSLIPAQYCHKV